MIKTFYYNDLRTCCYIISDDSSECDIVDPGCYKESEKTRLVNYIESNSLKPKMILQTHGHFDHIGGVKEIKEKYNAIFAKPEFSCDNAAGVAVIGYLKGKRKAERSF